METFYISKVSINKYEQMSAKPLENPATTLWPADSQKLNYKKSTAPQAAKP